MTDKKKTEANDDTNKSMNLQILSKSKQHTNTNTPSLQQNDQKILTENTALETVDQSKAGFIEHTDAVATLRSQRFENKGQQDSKENSSGIPEDLNKATDKLYVSNTLSEDKCQEEESKKATDELYIFNTFFED